MGRGSRKKERFYCPQCGKKTLEADSKYDHSSYEYHKVWVCKNQQSKATMKLAAFETLEDVLDDGYYYGTQAQKEAEASKKWEAAKAKVAKTPPCDLVIEKEGEDAEIADFGCVLDKLARTGEPIRYYLMEKNTNIHRKGFEVLHSTDVVDVVRLRDDRGVAVYLYWKMNWEPDYDGITWNQNVLTFTSSSYLSFQDHPLPTLFRQQRLLLWTKDKEKNSYHMKHALFDGSLTQKTRAKIIAFAKALEAALPQLKDRAMEAKNAWMAWGQNATQEIAAVGKGVSVQSYDSVHQNLKVNIYGWITTEQAKAIARILTPAEVGA